MDHLLANAPLFLIFGWFLRAFFGWRAFPLASILIGVLSNLATIATYPAHEELLGASGMLYGMVALWLVFYSRFATEFALPMRIFRAVGVSLLLLFPTTFEKNVSYMAHITGFAFGLAVGFLMLPFIKVEADVEDPPMPVLLGDSPPKAPSETAGPPKPAPDLHPPSRLRAPPSV
jgi:membrane associated rhomboid family serine protease